MLLTLHIDPWKEKNRSVTPPFLNQLDLMISKQMVDEGVYLIITKGITIRKKKKLTPKEIVNLGNEPQRMLKLLGKKYMSPSARGWVNG